VRFTSTRQELLWRIRGPLRRLDPEFAESLLKAHPELAKAAEDLPHGLHDSTHAPGYELSGKERAAQQRNEWDFVNHCWIPVDQWMMTCWEDGFLQAMALLDVDIEPRNPNLHPLEVWPSTQEFRMLMYKAGCYEDRDALERLQRVPNADVRLLARIELIAGMVGLPPFGGSSRSPRPVEDSPGMQAAKASTAFASLNLATLPMRWEGRSSARKVHTDFAEWDPQHRRWAPALRQEASSFRQDGRLEQTHGTLLDIRCEYDHDDRLYAIELIEEEQPKRFVCTYDENQHLIRVEETVTLAEETPDNILSIGGWSFSSSSGFQYSATPAGFRIEDATGIEIEYDGAGRRAAFAYARNGDPLCRVERQWNSEGRLLREIQTPYFPEADFEVPSAHLNFEYDSRGRCIRLENEIAEDYRYESTFLYDDNDTVVEANSREHRQRFEYTYDSHGNWTERVTRAWNEDKSEYVEVCIERRRIEYF
jgi:hypothetical protein